MKASQVLLPLSFAVPALSQGMVGWGWKVDDMPEAGVKDLVFPMKITGSPSETRYYFANQFNFVGEKDVGYTGLQPRPNENGTTVIHGVFSNFVEGSTTDDTDFCSPGADGGPGVSCAVDVAASYDHIYNLVVSNVEGTTWEGSMVDTSTGEKTHIGRYTLPNGSGIGEGNLGFIEDYIGGVECNERHHASITMGDPFSESGGLKGKIDTPYEYGPCPEKANFASKRTAKDDGWEMTIGWQ